jgi:UDP-N-acetylglucosamine:LPS N-acetylglucosamine transferase
MTAPAGDGGQTTTVDGGRGRIVIITASVGAGHDGAAREWAEQLRGHGFKVETYDLLSILPRPVSRSMREGYEAILNQRAWAWTLLFWLTAHRFGAAVVKLALVLYRARLRRLIPADTVATLSTYPLASQMLGQMRRSGDLTTPVFTFITDFSVHRLWVADGIDAHYVVHEHTAQRARALDAANVEVTGPLVPERFRPASSIARSRARAQFALPADQPLALLVAGSWGVGDVEQTAIEIARTGVAVPVVACGRNAVLRERLERLEIGYPLGWVSEMDVLLQGVDVLVENAGGLSSLEAMAAGVPVATYRPIPGHGQTNAAALDLAGASTWIRDETLLGSTLQELMNGELGRRQRELGLSLFSPDPAKSAAEAAVPLR